MKLKKLMAYCVMIITMGILLTGCSFNIRDALDEISSVVNTEDSDDTDYEGSDMGFEGNSDTDYEGNGDTDYEDGDTDYEGNDDADFEGSDMDFEGSDTDFEDGDTDYEGNDMDFEGSDTNAENSNAGTWVLTETKYYAYMNGEEPYCFGDNSKYRCSYSVTDDNFVKLLASGGFTPSSNPNNICHIDANYLCSIPDNSYPAGGLVTLQVKTYTENVKGDWYPCEGAWIGMACEDKEEAAGMDPYLYFLQNMRIKFYSALKDKYDLWVDGNTNDTLTVNMPEEAKNGDRIAIVFHENMVTGNVGEYGVGTFAMWIYTFTE